MELLSIFTDIGDWIKGIGLLGIISGVWWFVKRKGLAVIIDKYSKRGAIITKEIGEAFLSTSDALTKVDEAIKDDGSLIESSVKDVIDSGKEAITEWEDVIISIKPKKK